MLLPKALRSRLPLVLISMAAESGVATSRPDRIGVNECRESGTGGARMFVSTFMHVAVRGLTVESIAADYADWTLGLGSAKARQYRLDEGVLGAWTQERLLGSESLVGEHGCRIDMRVSPERMLVRFVHRAQDDGAVLWHTAARAKRQGDVILLEHAVGREAPRDHLLHPIASPSRIVLDLLDRDHIEVSPRELRQDPIWLSEPKDVRNFVNHVLTRSNRELPMLVVACDRGGKPSLVEPEKLARKLRGMCAVATLLTQDATIEFSSAMADAGFGQMFRCFNGAIHTYGPTKSMEEDHRLWLGERLLDIDPRYRVDHVAGFLARRIAVRDTPQGFFTQIEEADREERRALALKLSEKRSSPPPRTDLISPEYAALVEKERSDLQAGLKEALRSGEFYFDESVKAEDDRRRADLARDQAEAELEQERLVSAALRDQLGELKSKALDRPSNDAEARDTSRMLLSEGMTPHACLLVLRLAYADRIVLLENAVASAKKSDDFRFVNKLTQLLVTLATDYFDAVSSGKGDAEAKNVFGKDAFAANESEQTRSNKRAVKERSFLYRGRTLVMWPHLKIGTAETTAETIRVHFAWVPEEAKIVIGWCGEHRYRVG